MYRSVLVLVMVSLLLAAVSAQADPIDVFADEPALGDGFIRLGCWNLRHINLESGADDYLLGDTEEEDFEILTETFAKAIGDLGLDVVAISEHQPQSDEPNRLHQIRDELNATVDGTWLAHESEIGYGPSGATFGRLQLAVLWNSERVTIDPDETVLLSELRQPRDEDTGELMEANYRAPWLVPVASGELSFDMVIVHLASGGAFPQKDEVDALEQYIREHQASGNRHLVLCGDWNIRPDTGQGRRRLEQLRVPVDGGHLMRILTTDCAPLTLEEWGDLDDRDLVRYGDPVANLVPFSHYNDDSIDTFLDHLAVSQGLDELFDHPIAVTLASGRTDVRPGVWVARPMLHEPQFHSITDHLPVVAVLRTTAGAPPSGGTALGLRIVAAIPNPVGADADGEEVWVRNDGNVPIRLQGWRIEDDDGGAWDLTSQDGIADPGEVVHVVRGGRPMHLNNNGDTVLLVNPDGGTVDQRSYDSVTSGEIVNF